jgi:amino acid adenylation domain-containing protein
MSAAGILVEAIEQNVQIWAEDGELCFRSLGSGLSSTSKQAIREHKPALLDLLGDRRKHAVASYAQRRLWFIDQLEPGSAAYNMHVAFQIDGALQPDRIERCINDIVQRHEALRTRFTAINGVPVQIVEPECPIPIEIQDQTNCPRDEEDINRLAVDLARAPFDLAQGPLLRVTLVALPADTWYLILVTHHIVFDGWSVQVLLRELSRRYNANETGASIPDMPFQYADHACRERQRLDQELESHLAYWHEQLSGDLPVLQIPTDRLPPSETSMTGGRCRRILPLDTLSDLKAFSRSEGVTLFMTLLAAYQVLLARYTGQSDICVGSPVAGRGAQGSQELIGFFANTLALRADLSENPTFRELLERVRPVVLGALQHQEVPFEKVVELVQPDRNTRHAPLFQVVFALQNIPKSALELDGTIIRRLPLETGLNRFDLSLLANESPEGLIVSIDYNGGLITADTAERMLSHYETLLRAAFTNPTKNIGQLPILSEDERHRMLVTWNDTAVDYGTPSGFQLLFETQVDQTPDAIAVTHEDDQRSYRDLNEQANRLAHHLRDLGVGPEVLAAICLQRSPDAVVAMLAILKAGGAFVALDPTHPPERLRLMLEDAAPRVVLTHQHLVTALPDSPVQMVCLDTAHNEIAQADSDNPDIQTAPEHLAYVIYTSGSTGVPKGVSVEHRGLYNLARAHRDILGLGVGDRVLQFSTMTFDAWVWECAAALSSGAALCLAPKDDTLVGNALAEQLEQLEITITALPPSVLSMVPEVPLPALRTIISVGEPCPAALVQRWGSGRRFLNSYGPTEDSICTTMGACVDDGLPPPVGSPVANHRVYILDAEKQPVPIGVPGEMYLAGAGLARGYLNRPELTAERFLPDPFSADTGARLYRTGDLARWLPDGTVEYVGRLDHQVKLRGFRIELGEVESALTAHPDVHQAAVIVDKDEQAGPRMLAYVVPHPDHSPSQEKLRAHLGQTLPAYMIPARILNLSTLPLTPSGKLDRKALPVPDSAIGEESENYVAPRTSLEFTLVGLWEKLFDKRPIGVSDNFFGLGGHSFLVVRLVADIKSETGLDVPMSTLFEAPTIQSLASKLQTLDPDAPIPLLVPISATGTRPAFFCVHPAPGTAFCYMSLARSLGPDQPFYGLQAAGVNGECEPQQDIPAMAARYVAEIQAAQPHGPYILGGHSSGGVIAYEMAQQLIAQGEEVPFLALMEVPAPLADPSPAFNPGAIADYVDQAIFLAGLAKVVANFFGTDFSLSYKGLAKLSRDEQMDAMLRQLQAVNFLPPDSGITLVKGIVEVTRASFHGVWSYGPKPYPGKVAVFRSSEFFGMLPPGSMSAIVSGFTRAVLAQPGSFLKTLPNQLRDAYVVSRRRRVPTKGWGELSSQEVDFHAVPGNHITMLVDPNAEHLADRLRESIDRALET